MRADRPFAHRSRRAPPVRCRWRRSSRAAGSGAGLDFPSPPWDRRMPAPARSCARAAPPGWSCPKPGSGGRRSSHNRLLRPERRSKPPAWWRASSRASSAATSAERAASRRSRHDFARDSEQARADFQVVRFGRGRRNVETHFVLDDDEIDHAAELEPLLRLGDREQGLSLGCSQDFGQAASVDAADEQDVQARDRVARPEPAHEHRPAVDIAAGDDLRELVGQRIGAHHADRNRTVRAREAPLRPLDVAAELVEERSLDAVLVGLRVRLRRARTQDPRCDHNGESARTCQLCHRLPAQKFHLSFAYAPLAISLAVAGFPDSTWPESMKTTESSSPRSSRQAMRMSAAVYAGTLGLGSAPTRRTPMSSSVRSGRSNDERRSHWWAGSLPAALTLVSPLSGLRRKRCLRKNAPALRRQFLAGW